MYHRVLRAFGRSPLFTPGQIGLNPPWQQAPPDSSNSREPHDTAPDMHYAQVSSSHRCAITELPIVSLLLVPTRSPLRGGSILSSSSPSPSSMRPSHISTTLPITTCGQNPNAANHRLPVQQRQPHQYIRHSVDLQWRDCILLPLSRS